MKNQELLTERVVKKFQFYKIRERLKCEMKGKFSANGMQTIDKTWCSAEQISNEF